MTRILVIIVNYYTEEDVYNQVVPFKDTDIQFVIVNNGSRHGWPLDALAAFLNAEVVNPGCNLGYLNGGFFGLKAALATGAVPDWVLISNPDITFSHQFFKELHRIDPQGLAMLAPRIISGRTGKDQNPYLHERPRRKKLERLIQIHERLFLANLYRLAKEAARLLMRPSPEPDTAPVDMIYAPHGACMALSYTFLKELPELRYPAFLFCEELFFAEHARRQKLAVIYRPDLELCHKEHRTTSLFRNQQMVAYHREALTYCLKEFY